MTASSDRHVGQLYPSGGLADDEVQTMAPPGLRFHTTRMPFRRTGIADDLALVRDLEAQASLLADAEVELVAFNCTAASLLVGPAVIRERIARATGLASVTTIEAVLEALRAAGLRRIALATPYLPEVVRAEIDHFAELGFEVVAEAGIPCDTPVKQGRLDAEIWLDVARRLAESDADGLLLSCAGIRLSPVLGEIERLFGRPVVASNQALLWAVLRRLAMPGRPAGFGALLAGAFDAAAPPVTLR